MKGAAAGMAIGGAIKWVMTPTSTVGAGYTEGLDPNETVTRDGLTYHSMDEGLPSSMTDQNMLAMDTFEEMTYQRLVYGEQKAGVMRSSCYQDCKMALEMGMDPKYVTHPGQTVPKGQLGRYRKLLNDIIKFDPRVEAVIEGGKAYGNAIYRDRTCAALVNNKSFTCK